MTDPCWRCGGPYAPLCCGDPPGEQMPGQADLLEELAGEARSEVDSSRETRMRPPERRGHQ